MLVAVKGAAASVVFQGYAAGMEAGCVGQYHLPGTYTLAVNGNDDFLTQLDNEQFLPQEQKEPLPLPCRHPTLTGIAA